MTYSSIANSIPEDSITDVVMKDGRTIKCKKISRELFSEMESFLPELKNLTSLIPAGLEYVATLGNTELYFATGDVSQCINSQNGGILSQTKDADGKFNGAVSFTKSGLKAEGLKVATGAAKAIPWIGLAITVIEVGVSIVKREKAIKAEERKFYIDKISELREQHDMLWDALNDYTTFVADDATRSGYLANIIKAHQVSVSKFNEVRTIIESKKVIDDVAMQTLKTAVTVFALSYILKILYTKTDSREYIERATEEIKEKTEYLNEMANKAYAQNAKKTANNQTTAKVAERVLTLNFKNKTARILGGIATGGVSLALGYGADKLDEKMVRKDEKTLENITDSRMESNPYVICLQNLEMITQKDNLVLFDEDYLYYQIPEKITE